MIELMPVTDSLSVSRQIEDRLEEIETTKDRDVFVALMQPGDVMVTAVPPSELRKHNAISRALGKSLSLFQRSPFSSSKLVVDKGQILGYGVSESKKLSFGAFAEYSQKVFVRKLYRAVLLRHVDMNDERAAELVKWARDRTKLDYAFSQLIKTFWNRTFSDSFIRDANAETAPAAKEYFEPMLCSSIIAIGHAAADLRINIATRLINMWPKDFLLNPSFKAIVQLDVPNGKK